MPKTVTLPDIVVPEDCQTMEDVRAGVDAIDVALVDLLTWRQGYMEAAARIKPSRGDIVVPWRIEEVVENVLREGEQNGLSPAIAEPVWRLLIEKCIDHEAATFERERGSGQKAV